MSTFVVSICILLALAFSYFNSAKPTQEEMAQAVASCHGQRIGDPAFRFPYDISCSEWVKIKVGDNEYTHEYLSEHGVK
jgi:hypothetical protein